MPEDAEKSEIVITIASIGRDHLLKTLASIDELEGDGHTIHVVIGDDSSDGKVTSTLTDFQVRNFTFEVVDIASRNISTCRNATLVAALGREMCRWVAFIDDDEIADPDWLKELLKAANENSADAVFGPVLSIFDEDVPLWLQQLDPLTRFRLEEEGEANLGRTGNALVSSDILRRSSARFDEALGRTGGEDTAFFTSLKAEGAKLWFCRAAKVREYVPASRMEPRYLERRFIRSGQTYGANMLNADGFTRKIPVFLGAVAKAAIGYSGALLLRPFNRGEAFILRLKGALNLGKIRHLLGLPLLDLY